MFLVKGLFTLPWIPAAQAFQEAHFTVNAVFHLILCFLPKDTIEREMGPFLKQKRIREDLRIVPYASGVFFSDSSGTNVLRITGASVSVANGLYEADKDACTWVVKHEIGHIKYNDNFTIPVVPIICQVAASIFGMCALSFLPAVGLAWAVGIVAKTLFTRWREAKADDFAIANSSDEELKGGRRFFMAVKKYNIDHRQTWWKRVENSARGDERIDFCHPSLTSRIRKIEKALRERNVKIDREWERSEVESWLQRYMSSLTP